MGVKFNSPVPRLRPRRKKIVPRAKIEYLSLEKIVPRFRRTNEYLVFENRAAGENFDVIRSNFREDDVKFSDFGACGEHFDVFWKNYTTIY